jgi:hypothetical protein
MSVSGMQRVSSCETLRSAALWLPVSSACSVHSAASDILKGILFARCNHAIKTSKQRHTTAP